LRAADDLAKRDEKRHAIVVLSDGGENYSRASAEKALDHASAAGATIYGANMAPVGPSRDIAGAAILKNLAAKGKRTVKDLPPEIQAQLNAIALGGGKRAAGLESTRSALTFYFRLAHVAPLRALWIVILEHPSCCAHCAAVMSGRDLICRTISAVSRGFMLLPLQEVPCRILSA